MSASKILSRFRSTSIDGAIEEVIQARPPGQNAVMEFNNALMLVGPSTTAETLQDTFYEAIRTQAISHNRDWDIKPDVKTYTAHWSNHPEDSIAIAKKGAGCFGEPVKMIHNGISLYVASDSDEQEVLSRYQAEAEIKDSDPHPPGHGIWEANGKQIKQISYKISSWEPLEDAAKIAIAGAKVHGLVSLERDGASVLVSRDSSETDVVTRLQKELEAKDSPKTVKGKWEVIDNAVTYKPSTGGTVESSFTEAIEGAKLLNEPVVMLSTYRENTPTAIVTAQSNPHDAFITYEQEATVLNQEHKNHIQQLETQLLPAIADRNEADIVRLLGELASIGTSNSDLHDPQAIIDGLVNIYGNPSQQSDMPGKRATADERARFVAHATIEYLNYEYGIPHYIIEQTEAYAKQVPSGRGQGGSQDVVSPRQPGREQGT